MRRHFILGLIVSFGVGIAGGCVADADKKLISTGAAVGQGNLNDWDHLTPAKQKAAHTNLVASYCVLDHSVNGRDLPAWVTSLISTAPPTGN